jgi:hypothetical protein
MSEEVAVTTVFQNPFQIVIGAHVKRKKWEEIAAPQEFYTLVYVC